MTDPNAANVEAAKTTVGEVSQDLPDTVDVDGEQTPLEEAPKEVQEAVLAGHNAVPTGDAEDEDGPVEDDGSVEDGDDPGDVDEDDVPAEDAQDESTHAGDEDQAGDDLAGPDDDDSWLDEQADEPDDEDDDDVDAGGDGK